MHIFYLFSINKCLIEYSISLDFQFIDMYVIKVIISIIKIYIKFIC
jgi:hypothetical protein